MSFPHASSACAGPFSSALDDPHTTDEARQITRVAVHEMVQYYDAQFMALESIADAFAMLDECWHLTFVNQGFERVTQLPRAALLDRHIFEALPQSESVLGPALERAMEERAAVEFEWYLDECDWWLDVRVYPSMRGVSIVARDITKQKQAEHDLVASERRFRALIQHQTDMIGIVGADGSMLYHGPSLARVLGYEQHELDGQNGLAFVDPDEVPRLQEIMATITAVPGASTTIEYRIRHKDGSTRWFESLMTNLLDVPEVGGIVLNSRDVTERTQAAEAERRSQEEFRALVENATDIIMRFDRSLRVSYINPAVEVHIGFPPSAVIGKSVSELGYPDAQQQQWEETLTHIFATGEEVTSADEMVTVHGPQVFQARMTPERGADGTVSSVLAIVRNITQQRELENQLRYQALHDLVTGLPNRALLMDRIELALTQSRRSTQPIAILFLDLDDFKLVNDTFGHEAGDRFLGSVAQRLSRTLRAGDTVARFGGDEFAILLHDLDELSCAPLVASRLLTALSEPFYINDRCVTVTASIGIVTSTTEPCDAGELLRQADIAMYHAKGSGKNCYSIFDADLAEQLTRRVALEQGLRQAIELGEFVVHYQPKVSLDTEQVIGLEALVRWQHPERGLVPPLEFIPIAEETGLIVPIGEWVMRESCRQLRAWQDAGVVAATTQMSVNLSTRQFQQDALAAMIAGVLADTDLDGACLMLEITESAVMHAPERAAEQLRELKACGIQVSIDDFGTGYSSLAYLKHFPVDVLKIDRSFVNRLSADTKDAAIVAATITIGHALDLQVVAEGVETREQAVYLRDLGCDVGQGYLYSRPEPAAHMASLLLTWPGTTRTMIASPMALSD